MAAISWSVNLMPALHLSLMSFSNYDKTGTQGAVSNNLHAQINKGVGLNKLVHLDYVGVVYAG